MPDTFDLHIRHKGQSHDFHLSDLSLTTESTDADIIDRVAGVLDMEASDFSGTRVQRNGEQIMISPEAVYG